MFLCGHRSRYGAAHLEAMHRHFDLAAVVLASDDRWKIFSSSLTGRPASAIEFKRPQSGLRRVVRATIPSGLLLRRAERHGRPGHALDFCRHHRVPRLVTDDANDDATLSWIARFRPEVVVSAAFPQILDRPILDLAPHGAVNFHPSVLPSFRGAHPHYWAIATGASTSGVTSHFMTESIDRGNIIAQIEFPIASLNYTELYDRIVTQTDSIVGQTARFFMDGGGPGVPQDDDAASFYCNDRDADHQVHWDAMSAESIRNLARTERAWAVVHGIRMEIRDVAVVETTPRHEDPGTVLSIDDHGVLVTVRDGVIRIATVMIDGEVVNPTLASSLTEPSELVL